MIESERLIVRSATLNDAAFMLQLLNSPGWLEYIGDRNVRTVEDAEDYLSTRMADNYPISGCGLFTIWLKDQDIPIGVSTLSKRDYLEEVDLGYALLPEYAGLGYAYEASKAVLDYALKFLKFKKIVAITLKNHTKSIQLLERLGFYFKRSFMESGDEMIEMEIKSSGEQ